LPDRQFEHQMRGPRSDDTTDDLGDDVEAGPADAEIFIGVLFAPMRVLASV
jgi:hypothetical protein